MDERATARINLLRTQIAFTADHALLRPFDGFIVNSLHEDAPGPEPDARFWRDRLLSSMNAKFTWIAGMICTLCAIPYTHVVI
jgi:hypothetical protein